MQEGLDQSQTNWSSWPIRAHCAYQKEGLQDRN